MKIKIFLPAIIIAAILGGTTTAAAMTETEKQALILQLQQQIAQLLEQVAQMRTVQSDTEDNWCHTFDKNLAMGTDLHDEVKALQIALAKQGIYSEAADGLFGQTLKQAVIDFQKKYRTEILTPVGMYYGNGFVGLRTRQKLNQFYGCATPTTVTPATSSSGLSNQETVTVDDVSGLIKNVCEIKPEKFGQNAVCVKANARGYSNTNNCNNYCKSKDKVLDKETIIIDTQDMYPNIPPYHMVVYDPANQTNKDVVISIDTSCGRVNYHDRCCTCKEAGSCKQTNQTCVALNNSDSAGTCKTYCNSLGLLPLAWQDACQKNGANGACCICQDLMKCENNWPLSECVKNDDSGKDAQTLCHNYCAQKYGATENSYNATSLKCAVGNATAQDVCCSCNKPASTAKNCIGKGEKQTADNLSLPCCPGLTLTEMLAPVTGPSAFVTTCELPPAREACAKNGQAGYLFYKASEYNYGSNLNRLSCCVGTIFVPNLVGDINGICRLPGGPAGCVGDGKQGAGPLSCCAGLLYVDARPESPSGVGTCLTPRCAAGSGSACI